MSSLLSQSRARVRVPDYDRHTQTRDGATQEVRLSPDAPRCRLATWTWNSDIEDLTMAADNAPPARSFAVALMVCLLGIAMRVSFAFVSLTR